VQAGVAGATVLTRVLAAVALLGATAVTPRAAMAQGTVRVRGLVTDSAGMPVEGVRVVATGLAAGAARTAETGPAGVFSIELPAGTPAVLAVRRIGYRPDTLRLASPAGGSPLRVVLQQVAVPVDPVRVVGRRQVSDRLGGFYRRQAIGHGRYFGPEEIAARRAFSMTDLLRGIPGARVVSRGAMELVRFRGGRCAPLVWMDGAPMGAGEVDLNAFAPHSFEGIEVYSGPSSLPAEFQSNVFTGGSCGAIVLWTARGLPRARPTRGGESVATALARLVEAATLHTAESVDEPARVDTARLVAPVYPDSLFRALVPGRVVAEFVVEPDGRVDEETISIVTATNAAFADAVRRAVGEQRFVPARRGGAAVRQLVQQPYQFLPDSAALPARRR
jgi:TonB family protein